MIWMLNIVVYLKLLIYIPGLGFIQLQVPTGPCWILVKAPAGLPVSGDPGPMPGCPVLGVR